MVHGLTFHAQKRLETEQSCQVLANGFPPLHSKKDERLLPGSGHLFRSLELWNFGSPF